MVVSGRRLFRLIIYLGAMALMVVIGIQFVKEKKQPVIEIPEEVAVKIPDVSEWRLRPLELAKVPLVVQFDWPVAQEIRAVVEIAPGPRMRMVFPEGKSDLLAMSEGQVVYTGAEGCFGATVSLAHRLEDGRIVQTLYGPLDRIDVLPGEAISRGDRLGVVTGDAAIEIALGHSDQLDTREVLARALPILPFLEGYGLRTAESLENGRMRGLESPVHWPAPASMEDPPPLEFSTDLEIKSAR